MLVLKGPSLMLSLLMKEVVLTGQLLMLYPMKKLVVLALMKQVALALTGQLLVLVLAPMKEQALVVLAQQWLMLVPKGQSPMLAVLVKQGGMLVLTGKLPGAMKKPRILMMKQLVPVSQDPT